MSSSPQPPEGFQNQTDDFISASPFQIFSEGPPDGVQMEDVGVSQQTQCNTTLTPNAHPHIPPENCIVFPCVLEVAAICHKASLLPWNPTFFSPLLAFPPYSHVLAGLLLNISCISPSSQSWSEITQNRLCSQRYLFKTQICNDCPEDSMSSPTVYMHGP